MAKPLTKIKQLALQPQKVCESSIYAELETLLRIKTGCEPDRMWPNDR